MLVTILLFAATVVLNQTPDLEQLRWHNRVLLLFADDPTTPELQKQKAVLEKAADGLAERDVEVYRITGSLPQNTTLRLKFGIDKPFAVVLIGKDGGRKLRATKPVNASELFALIDNMPMRKDEMTRRPQQ